MKQLSKFPNEELLNAQGPFVTIYQKVEMNPPNTESVQLKFKNHVKNAKEQVKHECTGPMCENLIAQLDSVPNDKGFWTVSRGSVAFFFTPQETYYYRVNTNLNDGISFGDKPNVLPLIEEFQYIENYYLLCLNNHEFSLYRGILDRIEPVELPEDAPNTIEKALGEELVGNQELNSGGGGGSSVHGTQEKSLEWEKDQENYFRIIDKYVFENYSRKEGLPLVVFALTENQAAFRALSKNNFLRDNRIEASPAQLNEQEIQKEVEKLISRVLRERHSEIINRYEEVTPQYKLGDQYQDLAMASLEGRIESLFIEKNAEIKGSIDDTGQMKQGGDDNFLNQLALNVLATKGKVYVLDRAQMPGLKDVAAILRY
ncbi:hypothetical protein [Jeotgalibaca caeni]|uniref:baeRF6 domain-containing protein n=1 Tax=Jeotgalibaca caeni TaxID=3028623 RepID=UPI00237D8211|nr:hypothetical protein [Jeotgalibaca caeni]MDE1548598.1 hypothetical protein [Jeotgalibaca caeni]